MLTDAFDALAVGRYFMSMVVYLACAGTVDVLEDALGHDLFENGDPCRMASLSGSSGVFMIQGLDSFWEWAWSLHMSVACRLCRCHAWADAGRELIGGYALVDTGLGHGHRYLGSSSAGHGLRARGSSTV